MPTVDFAIWSPVPRGELGGRGMGWVRPAADECSSSSVFGGVFHLSRWAMEERVARRGVTAFHGAIGANKSATTAATLAIVPRSAASGAEGGRSQ
jgi:hypothetical protein